MTEATVRIDWRWTTPLLAVLVSCSKVPPPEEDTSPPDGGESMPMITPPEGTGGAPPTVARGCVAVGLSFAHGEFVPAGDSCNSCLCYDGVVVCTNLECTPAGGDVGADAGGAGDAGTEVARKSCEVAGQSFVDSEAVPSGDSCNICTCSDGTVGCTDVVCDPVFCAEFVEESDGLCSRFSLDPCIAQDPDCGDASPTGP